MAVPFSRGKRTIAECDYCGFRYLLSDLRKLVVKGVTINTKVCPTCWEKDHPQLMLGMYPVIDPQAVQDPRRDNSLSVPFGSRSTQWGWNPVGLADPFALEQNSLVATGAVGEVTVTVS